MFCFKGILILKFCRGCRGDIPSSSPAEDDKHFDCSTQTYTSLPCIHLENIIKYSSIAGTTFHGKIITRNISSDRCSRTELEREDSQLSVSFLSVAVVGFSLDPPCFFVNWGGGGLWSLTQNTTEHNRTHNNLQFH